MLIKLNYSSSTVLYLPELFRVLREIINDSTITSIAALTRKATANSWTASLLAGLDTTTSYIIRTDSPDNTHTKAHIARPATASGNPYVFEFVLRQKLYDNANYHYYAVSATDGTIPIRTNGTSTNSSFSLPEWSPTVAGSGTTVEGYVLNVTNGTNTASVVPSLSTSFSGGGCFHAYVTDTSFMWCVSPGASVTGWTPFANPIPFLIGPFLNSQYERRDHWNTSTSSIVPVVSIHGGRSGGGSFGETASDFTGIINGENNSDPALSMYNAVANTQPSTATSWSVATNTSTYGWGVSYGLGRRYSDMYPLNATVATSTASLNAQVISAIISTTVGNKFPTPSLTSNGYPLFPLTFRRLGSTVNVSTLGGNITSIGKMYIFNGDYIPGDEYIYNNKTYVLWPIGRYGPANRMAYAIPKE